MTTMKSLSPPSVDVNVELPVVRQIRDKVTITTMLTTAVPFSFTPGEIFQTVSTLTADQANTVLLELENAADEARVYVLNVLNELSPEPPPVATLPDEPWYYQQAGPWYQIYCAHLKNACGGRKCQGQMPDEADAIAFVKRRNKAARKAAKATKKAKADERGAEYVPHVPGSTDAAWYNMEQF